MSDIIAAARADDPPPKKKRNMTVGPRKPVNPESVDRIEAEFNDWWDANDLELPSDSWDGARGPIGHWGTVEKFLRDKYPAAYQGFTMGLEEAADTLDRPEHHRNAYPTGPEAIAQYGYDPAEIAASLVLLHSQTHPFRRDEVDQRRLTDIFDTRMRMQREYDERRGPNKNKTAALDDDLLDRLSGEYKQWRRQRPKGSIFGGDWVGGIDHWPSIETFLKDRYPASYRGLEYGLEDAGALLDGEEMFHPRAVNPYETGPEAEAEHGYDPREIASAFLLLHNKTDRGRDYTEEDQDRLWDIAQKRMRMQRDYEKRTSAADLLVLAAKTQNGILADETIDRVRSEFRDWYEKKNPAYSPESASQHWTNIENFFADHYPATHRGLTYGYENARPLLKQKNDAYWGDIPDADPYETGPEAVEIHGYDPAEIAAAGLYLHNEGRWNRREFQNADRNLLMKVIRERHKMEQARNSRPRQLMLPLDLP